MIVETKLRSLSLRSRCSRLSSGHLNHAQYLQQTLDSIARHSSLNAFIAAHTRVEQLAINSLTGPLAGTAFSAKDNILSEAFATTAGSPLLAEFKPGRNAAIIDRLQDAGAILVGKNSLPEFCQSMSCNNASFGQVDNPAKPGHIPGGSSGGSAAAVAAGLVDFSIASDTGGSVRVPAALCGCVGFRPSIGRYSTDGFIPVSPMFDTPGILARAVDDIVMLDEVLAGAQQESPGEHSAGRLRIGVPRAHFYDDLHPEIAVAMEKTLGQLRSAGMILVEADVEGIAELNSQVGFPIAFYDMLREIAVFTAREGFDLSIHALEQGIVGAAERQAIQAQLREAAIPHSRYVTAIRDHLPQYIARLDRYFAEHSIDLLVVPTVPLPAVPARPLGEDLFVQHNGRQELMFTAYIRNTEPLSNYGGPCLTVPVATTADGRPIGMELAGRRHADRRLLITANQLQTLLRDAV